MIVGDFEQQNCVKCGCYFGVPAGFTAERRKDKCAFYCPNGHSMSYTESELDRIRRERDSLKQQIARVEDEKRDQIERALRAEKETKRLKKRASAGVCPCCNRTFSNMQRHMKSKHPNIVPIKAAQC